MLPHEALEILGLEPDATPSRIKEAYRDLVKVWHPDRFGTDPRLREKAQQKLAEVNQAWSALQGYNAPAEPKAQPRPGEPQAPAKRAQFVGIPVIPRRLWPLIGLAVIVLIAYPSLRYLAGRPSDTVPATNPVSPPQPPDTSSADQPPIDAPKPVPPSITTHSALSERERAAIESKCAPKKNKDGAAAYVHCLEQQLDQTKKTPPSASSKQVGISETGP